MSFSQSLVRSIIAALLSISLISCGQQGSDEEAAQPRPGLEIHGAGSTFISPLMWRWANVFGQQVEDTAYKYFAVGSGEGIERFIANGVDFGASDSAMNDAEIARVRPPSGRGVKLLPVTAGEVVIAYNIPGLAGTLQLPRDVYAAIFLGQIKRWNDERIAAANPGLRLPDHQIQVVARRDSSGTTFAFTNHLSAISDSWRNGPGVGKLIDWPGNTMVALGNEGVAQRLKISQNSIGYVEYGFARRLGLSMAALENRAGNFVAPGPRGGMSAMSAAVTDIPDDLRIFLPDPAGDNAYPLVSLVWLLVYEQYPDPARERAVKALVEWSLTEGQAIAEEMGYIPLSADLADKVLEKLHAD